MNDHRPGRFRSRIVLLTLMTTALCGWTASAASAHNNEVGSVPKEGAVVTEQPGEFSVTTDDDLLTVSSSLMLVSGPTNASLYYGDGCGRVEGASVETEAQLGAPGTYTVHWLSISQDGDPISGQFTFDWQPAVDQILATGVTTPPVCGQNDSATAVDASGTVAGAAASGLPIVALVGGGVVLLVLGTATVLIGRRRRERADAGDRNLR